MSEQERERGADGRFKAHAVVKVVTDKGIETKRLRPRQCSGYLRSKLAKEFPKIVEGFVNEARNGGCAHMKLAAELLERPKSERPAPKKGTAQRLLEELGE
jgi:hypothetical protein